MFFGYYKDLDHFYTWQGKIMNPAPGTVNAIMFSDAKTLSRYTGPECKSWCRMEYDLYGDVKSIDLDREVVFVIDNDCPWEKYQELLTSMGRELYSLREIKQMGFRRDL